MSNDYYFFCLAYSNIPAILSIIERKGISKLNIYIVVTLESRRLFWQELIKYNNLKWKIIFLEKITNYNIKNPLNWYKIRKDIKRIFENNFKFVCRSNIYFFSHSFVLDAFALIKMLSQANNKIYFLDCDKLTLPKWSKLYKLKRAVGLLILGYLYFGVDISIVNNDNNPIPTLSKRFFKKAKIQRINEREYPYDIDILEKYNFIKNDITENKSIVLLDDDCFPASSLSKEEYSKILVKLKKLIESNFKKNEVLFKRHPSIAFHTKEFNSIYSAYSECPSYLPADFIFLKPSIKWVIGGYSTVLRTIPKYYNVRSISYLKLIPFQNEDYKKFIIELQKKESDGKINLPNSWEELNLLLKGNNIKGEDN